MGQKTAGIPVEYRDVRYASYAALGRAFGLDPAVVKRRLALHQPLEVRHTGFLRKRSLSPIGSVGAKDGAPFPEVSLPCT